MDGRRWLCSSLVHRGTNRKVDIIDSVLYSGSLAGIDWSAARARSSRSLHPLVAESFMSRHRQNSEM